MSIDETMMFVANLESGFDLDPKNYTAMTYPKNMKTPWARLPHRAPTISSQVCA
jgi:hypothetical protein